MSEQQNQISKLAGALVEHQGAFANMSTADRQWVIQNTVAAINLFAGAVEGRGKKKILKPLSHVLIPGSQSFKSSEKFRVGETVDGIFVRRLDANFKMHFMSLSEDFRFKANLALHNLLSSAKCIDIIAALGRDAEIRLGQFWHYLKTADRELWHAAFIRDASDALWCVNANWIDGGLFVEAIPIDSRDGLDCQPIILSY